MPITGEDGGVTRNPQRPETASETNGLRINAESQLLELRSGLWRIEQQKPKKTVSG